MQLLQSFFVGLLLFLFISINGGFSSANPMSSKKNSKKSSKEESPVLHLRMIHKHSPEVLGGRTLSRSERIKDLLHSDKVRREIISHKLKHRHNDHRVLLASAAAAAGDNNNSSSLKIMSGVYALAAKYYVPFRVGTPAQLFLMALDTGSDLTWINSKMIGCNDGYAIHRGRCIDGRRHEAGRGNYNNGNKIINNTVQQQQQRFFYPERSRTFSTVPCSSMLCRQNLTSMMALPACPAPHAPCTYEYYYSGGTRANGIFGHDSLTVKLANGRKKKIPGMLIGCTHVDSSEQIDSALGNADGVFGISPSSNSFVSNVLMAFGGKFSYCLMDHNSPKSVYNYLTFGGGQQRSSRNSEESSPHHHHHHHHPNMQYTEMTTFGSYYGIHVEGIYINGVRLNIPGEAWDFKLNKGLIIDSGASLSTFTKEAYAPIMAALEKPLLGIFPTMQSPEGLNSCFNVTNNNNNNHNQNRDDPSFFFFDESVVPRLEIEFRGGARFKPPVKSYFMESQDDPAVRCIPFAEAGGLPSDNDFGTSVLGNIMQQNHFWEFDVFGKRLGFAPSSCLLRQPQTHTHK